MSLRCDFDDSTLMEKCGYGSINTITPPAGVSLNPYDALGETPSETDVCVSKRSRGVFPISGAEPKGFRTTLRWKEATER